MKILVVIDFQNDFISGSLGTKEALGLVPNVKEKIMIYLDNRWPIIFTEDRHNEEDYFNTIEGESLPTLHCIEDTLGAQINQEVISMMWGYICAHEDYPCKLYSFVDKAGFGAPHLAPRIWNYCEAFGMPEEIEFIGLTTDICVISNVLLTKAEFYNRKISVDARCCAGTSPEAHDMALEIMDHCHIKVKGKGKEPWRETNQ